MAKELQKIELENLEKFAKVVGFPIFAKPDMGVGAAGDYKITNIVKNIDMNSIKGHIDTAQKALSIVQELTGKVNDGVKAIKKPLAPKPLNKFFED